VQSGITVGGSQHATVDVTLTLGEVTETVDVLAEASLLDRASGALGQTIDAQRVEDMPLNGRMIFMLNRLTGGANWQVPTFGATGTSDLRPFDNGGGSAWSINGGQVSTNEFLLDGAPNSTRGRYNFGPPVDAVEEFRIQTNTYDAQYGRTGGGVVNMTLKSGSNAFRSQFWNFLKNDRFNANNAEQLQLAVRQAARHAGRRGAHSGHVGEAGEPDAGSLVQHVLRGLERRSAEMSTGREARVASTATVHAADHAAAVRQHPRPVETDVGRLAVQTRRADAADPSGDSDRSLQSDQHRDLRRTQHHV
jgi:hypothetical protein